MTLSTLRLTAADGAVHVVYSDANVAAVEAMACAVERRNGTLDHLLACMAVEGPLRLPTSIAFGGPDGRTAFVGSVGLTQLITFRVPRGLW